MRKFTRLIGAGLRNRSATVWVNSPNASLVTGSQNRACSTKVKAELSRWDHSTPVEAATTPPSSWFLDPEMYQLEKKAVFARNWIAVGRSDQVAKSGDYFSGSLGGEPYIVVRDGDNLRGFFNVCRHHAAQLTPVCSQGCVERFVCPYHGWTYALDGKLTKAMRLKGIQNFKAKENGLVPIKVAQMGPLVFINLDENASEDEFKENNTDIEARLDKTGYKSLQWVRRVEYPMNCNWKVFVDNYLDGGYHVEYLHPSLTSNLDINSYKTTVYPFHSVQEVGGIGDVRVGDNAVFIYKYPSLMINRYGPWMDTNMVVPTGPRTCNIVYDYFLSPDLIEGKSKTELENYITESLKASDKVQEEDNMICESVQIGLESSAYDVGRYAPKVEMADHSFHVSLAKQLKTYVGL